MNISLSPSAPKSLVSRDGFGSPVPRQPAHLHTQTKSGAYLRDSSRFPRRRPFIYLNRHTSSGQSQGYWFTQWRTDSVHCREFLGRGPVKLKVGPNGCCLGTSPCTNQHAPIFSHTHYWYEVSIFKVYTPLIEPSPGEFSPISACHKR